MVSTPPPKKKENFWFRRCEDVHVQVDSTETWRQFLKSYMKAEEL